jgi:hypothetical protein
MGCAGAGLLAMAVGQVTGMLDVLASSLAGQLPQGYSVNTRIFEQHKAL